MDSRDIFDFVEKDWSVGRDVFGKECPGEFAVVRVAPGEELAVVDLLVFDGGFRWGFLFLDGGGGGGGGGCGEEPA